ncbi:MAG TPA: hypothetical protein VIY48_11160 [Candidatus Paceibacterota bacterium]
MTNLILCPTTRRAYLVTPEPVFCQDKPGMLIYGTPEGWVGVRLTGETRVDEYPYTDVVQGG